MSDGTRIEWADATVNAVNGCSVVSPGCTNCYAMRLAGTRMKHHPSRAGLTIATKAGPVWTGEVRLNEAALLQPLRWRRPRRIFWNAHGDLFHEVVPDAWIDRVFAVCALTGVSSGADRIDRPGHQHMILTKRSARMRTYFGDEATPERVAEAMEKLLCGPARHLCRTYLAPEWPLPNVWLGVSVEDQARADERIPDLLATPAAVRFISAEPLLGPVKIFDELGVIYVVGDRAGRLDWVIAGGESGPGGRPMHPDWARSLRDQCAAAGVAFHFKQWGEWAPNGKPDCISASDAFWPDGSIGAGTSDSNGGLGTSAWRVGKRRAGRELDGRTHDGSPA